MCHIVTACSVL